MTYRSFKLGKFKGVELSAAASEIGVAFYFHSPSLITATATRDFESVRAAIERFIGNATQHEAGSLEPQIYWFNGCIEFDFGRSFVCIPCDSQDVPPLYEILKKFVSDYEKAA